MEQENSLIPEEEIKNPEILEISTNDEPVAAESKAVENAKEKKEVPEIDFSILSTGIKRSMKKHWPSSLPTEINRKISNTKTTTGNVSMPSTSSIKIKKTLQPGKRKPNAKKI